MDIDTLLRRLRGTLGTALLWGAGWAALATLVMTVFAVLSVVGLIPGGFSWGDAFVLIGRVGVVGTVVGVAFSTFIGLVYRGRRLSELNWVRFGLGGALVAGLFVPLFLQTMNLLSGDGLVAWELVLDDGIRMALFGGLAAGGSLKVAQIAEKLSPGESPDVLDSVEDDDRGGDLPAGV